jgi:Putative phage serine protease XkdF
MKIYFPFAKIDAEQREVWGYASTEARDDQGEIIKRDALIAALGDYMKFANIREMHQLSAVGVAKEAAVDDKGLYVGAKIVDDQAWQKVVEGVYKGYSIGGRITHRDPADFKTITGLVLNEISLVDRPANPEAIFDYWKAAGTGGMSAARLSPPFQIWACGVPEHYHVTRSEAVKCQQNIARAEIEATAAAETAPGSIDKADSQPKSELAYGDLEYADPGYQADGKKRYPIDNEGHIRAAWNFINRPSNAQRYTPAQLDKIKSRIIAAWKEKINQDGPPSAEASKKAARHRSPTALTKALWDVGHIARIILDLKWLEENLAVEAAMEDDSSAEPSKLQAIIAELCSFLNAFVAEETEEILNDAEMSGGPSETSAADMVIMAGGTSGAAFVADLCRGRSPEVQKFAAAILLRSQHSQADQALLDLAYHAVDKCIGMDGLLFAEKRHVTQAREALKAAGAMTSQEQTGDATSMSQRGTTRPGESEYDPRKRSSFDDTSQSPYRLISPVLEMVAKTIGKIEPGHQSLLDIAHDCIAKLTDGICCVSSKAGARHSQETLDHLVKAHGHLVAAGAQCDTELDVDREAQAIKFQSGKTTAGNLAKILAGERAEKAALMATLTEILPRLDQLTKRVEDIARTPLPPLTVAKPVTAISKQQDAAGSGYSADELAAAFGRMSKEEQTLTLIKASYARPIHPPGLASGKDSRDE